MSGPERATARLQLREVAVWIALLIVVPFAIKVGVDLGRYAVALLIAVVS